MENLVYFYPEGHEGHQEYGHPERPERIETIWRTLQAGGWVDSHPALDPVEIPADVMYAIHDPGYLRDFEQASRQGIHLDADTYTTPLTWDLAHKAAGGAAAVAGAVWQRTARRGFALTRPPGHHATRRRGMGFCLLNNVALASEYLIQEHGAQRLAIVDLDLHHGNGTQDIFWERGEVFYCSTHQFPHYPGTGRVSERGAGPGADTNANIPLSPNSGDHAFRAAMERVILPLLDRYQPQMLLVSFGFDTHWRDPLGQLLLSAEVYKALLEQLAGWADQNCDGRMALFLEGGYDLHAAQACCEAAVTALLGEPWEDTLGPAPYTEGRHWKDVIQHVCEVWDLPQARYL